MANPKSPTTPIVNSVEEVQSVFTGVIKDMKENVKNSEAIKKAPQSLGHSIDTQVQLNHLEATVDVLKKMKIEEVTTPEVAKQARQLIKELDIIIVDYLEKNKVNKDQALKNLNEVEQKVDDLPKRGPGRSR